MPVSTDAEKQLCNYAIDYLHIVFMNGIQHIANYDNKTEACCYAFEERVKAMVRIMAMI